jgi:hypothetical protein
MILSTAALSWGGAHSTKEQLVYGINSKARQNLSHVKPASWASHAWQNLSWIKPALRASCGNGTVAGEVPAASRDTFCNGVADHPKNLAMPGLARQQLTSQRCGENPNFFFEFGNSMYCYVRRRCLSQIYCELQPVYPASCCGCCRRTTLRSSTYARRSQQDTKVGGSLGASMSQSHWLQ